MLAPALSDIGAHGVFANGIEFVRTKNAANFVIVVATGDANLKPIRPVTHVTYKWIAAPNTLSSASCMPSAIVGCAWMAWTTSATVPSRPMATTAS